MKKYHVSYMVVYSDVAEADTPEEAADIVADDCPYDIDRPAFVTDIETNETWEIW